MVQARRNILVPIIIPGPINQETGNQFGQEFTNGKNRRFF
jgi:hypothetical protein